MKKLILTLGLGLCLTSAFAQSTEQERQAGTTTKSGQVILPQAGDIAIGIDATSILDYMGNSLNGSTNNSFGGNIFNYEDNIFNAPTIYVKYFLSDNTALRVKLHLGFDSKTNKALVTDDAKVANDPTAQVEDSYKNSLSGMGIRVGYEMRRGYGRLQGFYGAEVGLGFNSKSRTFDYGNTMDKDKGATSNPFRDEDGNTNINQVGTSAPSGIANGTRLLKDNKGSTFQGMVGGFVGVEYFVAPKLSVGGEFGLGLRFVSTGEGKRETEFVDLNSNGDRFVNTNEAKSGGSSSFEFKTNYSAALNVAFHF